jgi:signal transduction histidine kinase
MGERSTPTVTIRAGVRGLGARVEVEDNGPGLPAEIEKHLFEPYVRGPETGTPGLGLGLSTVRRFVEGHGGEVGVRSVPDRGCVFWFELPLYKAASGNGDADGDLRHHASPRSA